MSPHWLAPIVQIAPSSRWDIWLGRSRQALSSLHISITISTLTWPRAQAQTHCSDTAAATYEDAMCKFLAVASFQLNRTGVKNCFPLPCCANKVSARTNGKRKEGKSERLGLSGWWMSPLQCQVYLLSFFGFSLLPVAVWVPPSFTVSSTCRGHARFTASVEMSC